MKDKMIPEVVMSILYSRYNEYKSKKILNSPFVKTSNDFDYDYGYDITVSLHYLKEVLEDIFGAEDE
jgi:hypothetical protein